MKKTYSVLKKTIAISIVFVSTLWFNTMAICQDKTSAAGLDDALLEQYIQSKGVNYISFDSKNIKQFWVEKTVISKNGFIEVLLNGNNKSDLLKIQFANVNATQKCIIEVIANENDFDFSVLNNSLKVISTSPSDKEAFLHYNIISSVINLEDTPNYSFYLSFSSKGKRKISIKKIIMYFSNNESFLASPGLLKITGKDVTCGGNERINGDEDSFFVSGGNWLVISSIKKIVASNTPVSNHVTIKNIGSNPTNAYFGYAPYTVNRQNIHNRNNPYNNKNQILNVIASEANSNKIVVDSYPDWKKGCYLVLDAKEDLSDFPNFNFIESAIDEVKKIDDTHTEIFFAKPVKSEIKIGTKVRIHSSHGNGYLYTNHKRLEPGEEVTFSSTIMKDENFLQYSPKAFCRGTYYVVPIILSSPVAPGETSTIQVSDFTVSY